MMKPATEQHVGQIVGAELAMNCDRVSGLMALYAVIARKEYENISKAVSALFLPQFDDAVPAAAGACRQA